jgi:hypothetical protein
MKKNFLFYFRRWIIFWSEMLEGLVGVLTFGIVKLNIYGWMAKKMANKYFGTYKFVPGNRYEP